MTCRRFEGKVGYQGQEYAVVGNDEHGNKKVLGWQNGTDLSGWLTLATHLRLTDLRVEKATGKEL